ncbi:acyl-CoA-binding protein-like isoform X3 [Lampris incognitus]|uniref:acyl-CoA-binding protein-like isoform X3 n=1 Tax=Lampris incognitus TaxID=2546036 RepID=UPI0024B56784|nr:acyl-CoA-binding protein-like isoform X3 [Lampris incognitus]
MQPQEPVGRLSGAVGEKGERSGSKVCLLLTAIMSDSFQQAAEEVKVLKKRPDREELSSLYGLYKQATVGDVNIDRPGFLDVVGQGKWDAWNARKGLSRDEAMASYVSVVENLKAKYGV